MGEIKVSDVRTYVKGNISVFHDNRLKRLQNLKLSQILLRKNPYLFKAKNISRAQDLVKTLLDAYLSSQEETIFGDFLEDLAVFINKKVYKGWKSSAQGIDLEFDRDGKRYIVAIKSGPNWGNSSQIRKMRDDFKKAQRTLRTSNSKIVIVAVNGCCYGRDNNPDKGDYYKYCGQEFWKFISGNQDLYVKLIKPLGYSAKKHNAKFRKEYDKNINRFTLQFGKNFVDQNGQIDWDNLVKYNSGTTAIKLKK